MLWDEFETAVRRVASLKQTYSAWQAEHNPVDAEGFAKLMNEMNAQSPAAYKALLTDRNANWADQPCSVAQLVMS